MIFLINSVYIVCSVLFIMGLKLMSSPATARRGNLLSAVGMFLAVIITLLDRNILSYQWILIGIVLGALIGVLAARLVAMTDMPQMVAAFNGFGGIASLLVAWVLFFKSPNTESFTLTTLYLSVFIGGITFTGSMVAFGKLDGKITTKPVLFRGQQFVNSLILLALLCFGVLFLFPDLAGISRSSLILYAVILSGILGVMVVIPIGGADMPVVISLLNSYSGLAACAAGFAIRNNLLIVSGALVGASGIILTNIMCKAMNRSLTNVLFSGFGSAGGSVVAEEGDEGEIRPINSEDAYLILEAASSVVIIPGYGMAVAQAQHVVRELADLLEQNGAEVNFAIHPVAGRMPGHMNVLLAEANVSYDKMREMDDINPMMETVDVAIVIGANDVVNPAAREVENSPIYGMPIISADKARTVFVLKRSMRTGFAGIGNPLFFKENTRMLFGDAKASIQAVVAQFKES
ncbi:NAD(P)(+) transhydrogenase (Re/Si-specific) subunit beta [Oceanispirochaeta crateris]|uniref:NAD(P) transhydrogenase subunit beta n=1 Tax=Oceanispirochaeta crateris TaxID=2518645 RepID=A0A5C1QLG8_9SPIO|nr:NAD(P)(+) transhydrogenase (Re/Si-specific) subunit beta [Oceanispirochaeta crateris]QEN08471.1 NAD(P)(+) transhydrogenase (Re/Si-specific) subunit beta [Oceanispirochaeta crateris]